MEKNSNSSSSSSSCIGTCCIHPKDDTVTTAVRRCSQNNNNNRNVVVVGGGGVDYPEAISQCMFQRFNPILRMLCEAVKEYHNRQQQQQQQQPITGTLQEQRLQQSTTTIIPLLRVMGDILEQLQRLLQSILTEYGDGGSSGTTRDVISMSMAVLMEYLTLPLFAIIRTVGAGGSNGRSCNCWDNTQIPTINNNNKNEIQLVYQSAVWMCLEKSCHALRLALLIIHRPQDYQNLPLFKYLSICLVILPSGPQMEAIIRSNTSSLRLDHGENCLQSLFETIQILIQRQPESIYHRINTDILPRILETSIAVIEPAPRCDTTTTTTTITAIITTTNTPTNKTKIFPRDVHPQLQVSALEMIMLLLVKKLPQQAESWRRIFPGVYAGLYRRILHSIRDAHTQSGTQMMVLLRTIDVFVRFLEVCLYSSTPQYRNHHTANIQIEQEDVDQVSSFLDNLAVKYCSSNGIAKDPIRTGVHNTTHSEEEVFFREINQRLPTNLVVLIHLLSTARSAKVRAKAVCLHSTLLGECRFCWDKTVTETLITASFESCLILTWDTDKTVAKHAKDIVECYYKSLQSSRDTIFAPRVLVLIEKLPYIAQSTRENDLQDNLKLLLAYLTINNESATNALRTSLRNVTVSSMVRKAFAMILDIQFDLNDPHQSHTMILVLDTDSRTDNLGLYQLHYMNETTAQYAYDVIRAFGKLLGPKQAVMFVDDCVADLYDACTKHVIRRSGHGQVRWLHEWIGLVKLTQEILVGNCTDGVETANTAKASKKRIKFFRMLAQSILPLVTTHPLWTMPTMLSLKGKSSEKNAADIARIPQRSVSEDGVVMSALRGNAALLCGFLGLVNTMIAGLGSHCETFAPVLLYPLLEKLGHRNCSSVRAGALSVLKNFAELCGYSDVSALIAANMESSLMTYILGKIRTPGGQSCTIGEEVDDSFLSIVDCVSVIFRISGTSLRESQEVTTTELRSSLSYIESLTKELTTKFDHSSTTIIADVDATQSFLRLFDCAVELLQLSRNYTVRMLDSLTMNVQKEYSNDDEHLDLEEELGVHRSHKYRSTRKKVNLQYVAEIARDTAFISHLAWRCGYLLSHRLLLIQVQSCDVLLKCFTFLGSVSLDEGVDSGTANGPKTAILRQVHASWPAIQARMNATCLSVTGGLHSSSLMVVPLPSNMTKSTNIAEQRVYLAKLLELISVMIQSSDDFMVKHFREAVWPCIHSIVRSYSERSLLSPGIPNGANRNHELTGSEKSLILSTVRCIQSVYDHKPTATYLSDMIPTAGKVLFSLLDEQGGSIATEIDHALKSMIKIKSVALRALLVEISSAAVPSLTVNDDGTSSKNEILSVRQPQSIATSKMAENLLVFIDSMSQEHISQKI